VIAEWQPTSLGWLHLGEGGKAVHPRSAEYLRARQKPNSYQYYAWYCDVTGRMHLARIGLQNAGMMAILGLYAFVAGAGFCRKQIWSSGKVAAQRLSWSLANWSWHSRSRSRLRAVFVAVSHLNRHEPVA
jgi:hypothetical protein